MYSWLVKGLDDKTINSDFIITSLSEIVPQSMSWVSSYWVFVAFSLVMVVIILCIKFPQVQLNEDEKAGTKDSYIKLFKNKYVVLYFFGIFAYVGTEQGISYWMSKFLQQYHGFDYETIGAGAVANFWGLMTVGGILGLFLLKILDSKLVLKIFTILSVISLALALFGSAQTSYYSFQSCGFFLSVMYPIIISASTKFSSQTSWFLCRDFDDRNYGRRCCAAHYWVN